MNGFMSRLLLGVVLVIGGGSLSAMTARAAEITQEQATAILTELKQIRMLLEKMQAQAGPANVRTASPPVKVKLVLRDNHALGTAVAPLTLVEFTDYQCPFCNKFHTTTFADLKKNYIETGKVRFVSRDLPLEFHKNAFEAARAARCAGDQGKYWEVRDRLSSNPNNLGQEQILQYAQEAGVDVNLLRACLASEKYRAEIQKDIADAQSVGITGTPGFILGRTSQDGFEGYKMVGAQPISAFEAKINELLGGVTK